MKHKIVLLFLVTSLSMATAPVLAINSGIPSKSSVTLDNNNLSNNNAQNKEEKSEGRNWFSTRNVGVGVALTVAVYLIYKYLDSASSSSNKKNNKTF